MSFVITAYVREGIVMASDSRLTFNSQKKDGPEVTVHLAVGMSDSSYKTFMAPGNIGISTYGAADIQGVPIAGYIQSFILEKVTPETADVEGVSRGILEYFRQLSPALDTHFYVAGYGQGSDQKVFRVDIVPNTCEQVNPPGQQGAAWGGEADILSRLIHQVAVVDDSGTINERLPTHGIPWQYFTLQDAIDFCIFAVRSTIEAIRFQPRPKTVGGPIDVLVIQPGNAFWIRRKELGTPTIGST